MFTLSKAREAMCFKTFEVKRLQKKKEVQISYMHYNQNVIINNPTGRYSPIYLHLFSVLRA